MAQANFTDRWVASVKGPDGTGRTRTGKAIVQEDWSDTKSRGLMLRVGLPDKHGASRKTWFCKFTVAGEQRKAKLGTYPATSLDDARKKARAIKGKADDGIDAVRERKAAEAAAKAAAEAEARRLTFKGLADDWIAKHGKAKKRSWAEDERIINVYFKNWHQRPAEEIVRREVNERLHAIASKHGPVQANRCLAVIRALYNWALATDTGGIEANPAHKLPPPGEETEGERVFTDAEIKALWPAFEVEGIQGAALKLALVTGQRIKEVCRLTWAEIDEAEKTWTLPRGRNKVGKVHVVPLTDLALDILKAQKGLDKRWVFPSPTRKGVPVSNPSKTVNDIRKASGVADYAAHGLRRTCSTGMTKLGHTRFVADRVLGHVEGGVGRIYDRHDYMPEKRAALESWSLKLRQLLKLGGNVVVLEQQRF
ncbi:MAG: tyrosine-type recombinase/integrase [Alphaproteobacteria bacterium]